MAIAVTFAVVGCLMLATWSSASTPQRVSGADFKCTSIGLFPDPDDCKRYHDCVHVPNAVPEYIVIWSYVCEDDYAYDPGSTSCSLSEDDEVCTRGPIVCESPGQSAAVPEDPTLYWVCEGEVPNLYPVYYVCPDDQEFQDGECKEVEVTRPPGPQPPVNGICTEVGTWKDPADCYHFYTCTKKLKLKHHRCCLGYHFNPDRKKCVFGRCKN